MRAVSRSRWNYLFFVLVCTIMVRAAPLQTMRLDLTLYVRGGGSPEATVELTPLESQSESVTVRQPLSTERTTITIKELPSGRYDIRVHADGYEELLGSFDFTGLSSKWLSGTLVPARAVVGRVVDSEGRGVAGAEVCASPPKVRKVIIDQSLHLMPRMLLKGRVCATAMANGAVRLAGLPQFSSTVLQIRAPWSLPIDLDLEAQGENIEGMEWNLRPAGGIRGRILELEGSAGPVMVHVRNLTDRMVFADVEVDDQGRFEFPLLQPGPYRLEVEIPGRIGVVKEPVMVTPRKWIELEGLKQALGVVVTGEVRDSNENPVFEAQVVIREAHGENRVLATTTTDLLGRFQFERVAQDQAFDLEVTPPRGSALSSLARRGLSAPAPAIRVDLPATTSLQGILTSGEGSVPENAHLHLGKIWLGDNVVTTETYDSETGSFTLEHVPVGLPFTLVAWAEGFHEFSMPMKVEQDSENSAVRIVMERQSDSVQGTVVDDQGVPLQWTTVSWGGGLARTGSDGRFKIRGEHSNGKLSAQHRDFANRILQDVAAGSDSLRVMMSTGGSIEGTVLATDGSALTGVRISAGVGGFVRTDNHGKYLIERISPGKVVIEREDGSSAFPRQRRLTRVVEGETVRVDFQDHALLEGAVSRNGFPVSDARIAVTMAKKYQADTSDVLEHVYALTDTAGRFRAPGVGQGWSTVTVVTEDQTWVRQVELREGQPPFMAIDLPGVEIIGIVKNLETGKPLEGVFFMVHLEAVPGGPQGGKELSLSSGESTGRTLTAHSTTRSWIRTSSAADGTFRLFVSDKFPVTIRVGKKGYRSGPATLDSPPNDRMRVGLVPL